MPIIFVKYILQLLSLKILIKYLMSFLSVAVFLAVTSGFTVYTHYCSSTTIKQQSIVESHNSCEHNHDHLNLHDEMLGCETDCCVELRTNKCCTDKKEYFKMSEVFILPSLAFDDQDISVQVIIIVLSNINFEIDRFFKEPESTFSLPPPLSGKQIVVLYHQLKTEPSPLS